MEHPAVAPQRRRNPLAILALFSVVNLLFAVPLGLARGTASPDEDMVVPKINPITLAAGGALSAVQGPQHWVTLLCRFSDVNAEPQPPAFFEAMFERTDGPSLSAYWREVSYNAVPEVTTDVFGWYTLPNPQTYYGFGSETFGFDTGTVVEECAAAADAANPAIDFTHYDAVAVMVNAPEVVASATWITPPLPDNAHSQMKLGSIVMPSDKYNLAVVAHEIGHAYSLDHSSANGKSYENPWDVMGIPSGYRCGVNADPVYSCLGQHTIASYKDALGWIPAERKYVAPQGTSTITLERLALPQTDNYLMAQIDTSTVRYVVEARQRVGFDAKLADDAVLIYIINDLVDADGAPPYDDEGVIWRPGETFSDAARGVTIRVDAATATGFTITITNANEPPGPPELLTVARTTPPTPRPGGTVALSTELIYKASSTNPGNSTGARVTVTFPDQLTYQMGSALITGGLGTIVSQNPLVIEFEGISQSFGASFVFNAVVDAAITDPAVLQAPVTVEWSGGTEHTSHTLIVNGHASYLPLQMR